MRVILFLGKGGVGKTSVAAATALRAAQLGHKTIILSTDAAHSLSDAYEMQLGNEPCELAPNLWGQETSLLRSLEAYWKTIQEWLVALMSWRGVEEMVAQELAILPGMEELANLLYILDHAQSGKYEAIIVDCAPTGESLRLLSFPEVIRWWMDKIFPLERKVSRITRPIVRTLTSIPYPEDKVFQAFEDLFHKLDSLRSLLTNPDISSVRLVVNAEKMVIREAQRSFTYLNLYGYATDAIICNRLLPDEVKSKYFDAWKESQSRHYQTLEECFSPIPILTIPLFSQEVVGKEMLISMARELYRDEDPLKIFYRGQPFEISEEDGHYLLTLSLPFVSKENLALYGSEDELIIEVGDCRRNILLPRSLWGSEVTEAKFEGGKLKLRLERKNE